MKNSFFFRTTPSGTWLLLHEDGHPAVKDEVIRDFRGDPHTLLNGCPPPHEASSGRVQTSLGSFYPTVLDLVWVRAKSDGTPEKCQDAVNRSAAAELFHKNYSDLLS